MNKETKDAIGKLKIEIDGIRHRLETLSRESSASGGKYQPSKQESIRPPSVLPEANSNRTGVNRADAESKEEKWQQKWNFRISVCTLIAVCVYTGFSGCQYQLTREFFERDQRPYIYGKVNTAAMLTPPEGRLSIDTEYVNHGKSPALYVKRTGQVFHGADAIRQSDEWFASLGDGPLKQPGSMVGETIVMQNEPPIKMLISSLDTNVPNVQVSYVAAFRIEYFDGFGNRYWSDVCYWRPVFGGDAGAATLMRCIHHNDIH